MTYSLCKSSGLSICVLQECVVADKEGCEEVSDNSQSGELNHESTAEATREQLAPETTAIKEECTESPRLNNETSGPHGQSQLTDSPALSQTEEVEASVAPPEEGVCDIQEVAGQCSYESQRDSLSQVGYVPGSYLLESNDLQQTSSYSLTTQYPASYPSDQQNIPLPDTNPSNAQQPGSYLLDLNNAHLLYSTEQQNGQFPGHYPTEQQNGQFPGSYPTEPHNVQLSGNYSSEQHNGELMGNYPSEQQNGHLPGSYPLNQHNGQLPVSYPTEQRNGQLPGSYPTEQQNGQLPGSYPTEQQNGQLPGSYPTEQQNRQLPGSYPTEQQNEQLPGSYPTEQQNGQLPGSYPNEQQNGQFPGSYPTEQQNEQLPGSYPTEQQNGQLLGSYPTEQQNGQLPGSYPNEQQNGQFPGSYPTEQQNEQLPGSYPTEQQNEQLPGSYPTEQQNEQLPGSYPTKQQNEQLPGSYPTEQQNEQLPGSYPTEQQNGQLPGSYPTEQQNGQSPGSYPTEQQNGQSPGSYHTEQQSRQLPGSYPMEQQNGQLPGSYPTEQQNGQLPGSYPTEQQNSQLPGSYPTERQNSQLPGSYPTERQNSQLPGSYPTEQQNSQLPGSYPTEQQNGHFPGSYPTEQQNGQLPGIYPSEQQNGQLPESYPTEHQNGHLARSYPSEQQNGQLPASYPAQQGSRPSEQSGQLPSQTNNSSAPGSYPTEVVSCPADCEHSLLPCNYPTDSQLTGTFPVDLRFPQNTQYLSQPPQQAMVYPNPPTHYGTLGEQSTEQSQHAQQDMTSQTGAITGQAGAVHVVSQAGAGAVTAMPLPGQAGATQVFGMLPGGYLSSGVSATPPPPAEPLDVNVLEAGVMPPHSVPSTDSLVMTDLGVMVRSCLATPRTPSTPLSTATGGYPAITPGYILPYDPSYQIMAPGMFDAGSRCESRGVQSVPLQLPCTSVPCTPVPCTPVLPAPVHSAFSDTKLPVPATPEVDVLPSPMVYPTVYVSPAGLLTVLLQHDVAVEMTIDRTVRVVNHRHKSVAATSSRGNSSCIYHAGAKLYQHGTTVEAEVFYDRRARMTSDSFLFASGSSCFELVPAGLKVAEPEFTDLTKDTSVTLLFSASGYGPHLVEEYERIAQRSKYRYHGDGSISIHTNGVKIYQSATGDVTVTTGRKRIRVSPTFGSLYIDTNFVEMAVEMNWNIKVRRGPHRLHASFVGFVLSDGHKECGFDAYRQVFCQPVLAKMHTIFWNGMSNCNMQQPPWNDRQRPRHVPPGPHGHMHGPPPPPPPPPHYRHHSPSRPPPRAPRRRPFGARTSHRVKRETY